MSDLKLEQGMSVLYWDKPGFEFVVGPDSDDYYVLKDPQGEFVFSTLSGISLPVLFYIDGAPVHRGDTVYRGTKAYVVLAYDEDEGFLSYGDYYPVEGTALTPQLERKEAFVVLLRDSSAMAGVTALPYPYPTMEKAVEAHANAFLIVKAEWEE